MRLRAVTFCSCTACAPQCCTASLHAREKFPTTSVTIAKIAMPECGCVFTHGGSIATDLRQRGGCNEKCWWVGPATELEDCSSKRHVSVYWVESILDRVVVLSFSLQLSELQCGPISLVGHPRPRASSGRISLSRQGHPALSSTLKRLPYPDLV